MPNLGPRLANFAGAGDATRRRQALRAVLSARRGQEEGQRPWKALQIARRLANQLVTAASSSVRLGRRLSEGEHVGYFIPSNLSLKQWTLRKTPE
jgi:hypothetical protein